MPTDPITTQSSIPHWYKPGDDRLTIVDANGVTVTDHTGNDYLDFISSLYCVNAGHANQAIIDAMHNQLNQVAYVSPANDNDTRETLATRLVEISPDSLSHVMLSVTGSEANEFAAQLARKHTDATKILTRWQSYHGATYGAGSLTGNPGPRNTVETHASTTGAVKFLPPFDYQSPFPATTPEDLAEQAADHLEYVIRQEDPDTVAAVLTEPVAGGAGALTAPPGYFARVREICDEYDVLLMADEVITGFGRCGDWFGIQTEAVDPDIITFAKAVTSGYAPLAGVMVTDAITETIESEGFTMGQTFGAHPVSCAAGIAALDQYDAGLIDNVTSLAPHLHERLTALADTHAVIGDVRGRGFLRGLAFADPDTSEPVFDETKPADEIDNPVKQVVKEARDRGVLVKTGRPAWQLLMAPPLSVTRDDIDHAIDALDHAITTVFA